MSLPTNFIQLMNGEVDDGISPSNNGNDWKFNYDSFTYDLSDDDLQTNDGLDQLLQWCQTYCRTQQNEFPIFDTGFGVRLREVLFEDIDRTEINNILTNDIKNMVNFNNKINSIYDIKVKFDSANATIEAYFTLNTIYGTVGVTL